MRLTIGLTLAATLLLQEPAAAQAPPGYVALAEARAKASKPVLTERYGADALRRGDLRLPAGKGPFPVAVLIHGGCFLRKVDDLTGMAPVADALAKRGIATWNIEYRALGDAGAGWPGTFQDISAGVDHLKNLARRYPLDLRRTALVGHSAGAFYALWAASRPRLTAPWNRAAVRPVAVAAIDGPGTLAPFVGLDKEECGEPVIVPLMGGTPAEKPAEYRLASPQDQLPLGLRTLLVKSYFKFALDPYEQQALQKGEKILSLAPKGANHFDVITPGTANGDAVVDWLVDNLFAKAPASAAKK